jgi:hypothetical protein
MARTTARRLFRTVEELRKGDFVWWDADWQEIYEVKIIEPFFPIPGTEARCVVLTFDLTYLSKEDTDEETYQDLQHRYVPYGVHVQVGGTNPQENLGLQA